MILKTTIFDKVHDIEIEPALPSTPREIEFIIFQRQKNAAA